MKDDLILFIHRGASWYLYYAVKQARFYHPSARIAVITDVPQPQISRYAEIYDIADYWSGATEVAKVYEHHSPNSVAFELFCFQRWFVIRDFLARNNPGRAIHLDSDVLVYGDLFRDFDRMNGASLGIVGFQGPYTMLIPTAGVIEAFCARILRLYRDEKESLRTLYAEWTKTSADVAVSDMHALHTFLAAGGFATLDLSQIVERTTYDTVLHVSDGFRTKAGAKDITWIQSEPWVHRKGSGEAVRLKTIHCQGAAKNCILDFFTARDVGYWRDKAAAKAKALLKKALLPPENLRAARLSRPKSRKSLGLDRRKRAAG